MGGELWQETQNRTKSNRTPWCLRENKHQTPIVVVSLHKLNLQKAKVLRVKKYSCPIFKRRNTLLHSTSYLIRKERKMVELSTERALRPLEACPNCLGLSFKIFYQPKPPSPNYGTLRE